MNEFVRVGQSGLKLSPITFGTALTIGTQNDDIAFATDLVEAAWSAGIRSFDTSNNYGFGQAETLLGYVLARYPRHEFVVSSKGSWPLGELDYERGLSRKHLRWAFDASYERLGLDYIDIYYAHRYDPDTPMEEVVRVFNQLIDSGKILYWATSEWPVEALQACHDVCDRLGMEKPILEQFIYSYAIDKADRNGVRDFCQREGVGMLGFSPLAQGLLTGKYLEGVPADSRIAKSEKIGYDKTQLIYEQTKTRVDHFNQCCKTHDVKGSHAAIRWALRNGVLPVLGASRPEQLHENVAALSADIPEVFWRDVDSLKSDT